MTNEEKDLLIALPGRRRGDRPRRRTWRPSSWSGARSVKQDVSGEAHYKAILDAAWVRERSYQRGYRTGGSVRWHEGEPRPGNPPDVLSLLQDQRVCDHDTPCGCYVEGYAAGIAEANRPAAGQCSGGNGQAPACPGPRQPGG